MTCDERLEKLLNKAGQTISDLPKGNRKEGAYPGQKVSAMQAVCQFDRMLDVSDIGTLNCLDYILHLTDVIDRLEWALDKTVRERDYLISEYVGCECCTYGADAKTFDGEPCASCVNEEHFEWSVPEDWRGDDENPVDA